MLLEHLGCDVKGFQHRSAGSGREIIQLIAKVIQDEIVDQVKSSCTYRVLLDDMTDDSFCTVLLQDARKSGNKVFVSRKCPGTR